MKLIKRVPTLNLPTPYDWLKIYMRNLALVFPHCRHQDSLQRDESGHPLPLSSSSESSASASVADVKPESLATSRNPLCQLPTTSACMSSARAFDRLERFYCPSVTYKSSHFRRAVRLLDEVALEYSFLRHQGSLVAAGVLDYTVAHLTAAGSDDAALVVTGYTTSAINEVHQQILYFERFWGESGGGGCYSNGAGGVGCNGGGNSGDDVGEKIQKFSFLQTHTEHSSEDMIAKWDTAYPGVGEQLAEAENKKLDDDGESEDDDDEVDNEE